jgi:hypothetical protein
VNPTREPPQSHIIYAVSGTLKKDKTDDAYAIIEDFTATASVGPERKDLSPDAIL